ncbi:hypothetical protein Agabi119p4_7245 [Agaricus bisporus var. burnettii]|uniref:Large ribosomal subunit protein uL29m n=1 Tax=Agaricus bisporus var. burnettii TaxID=192524 RepID=A0A8H7C797_AGABI|nr:hypothetical protein Agabi119p4_7245 [Agaricus bisporus var. burnettii]
MFALARTLRPQVLSPTLRCRRWFAEIVNASPPSTELSIANTPPVASNVVTKAVDWRKERVPVLENHGLYGFFRRKEVKPGAEEPEGEEKYEVLESPEDMQKTSGRGWKAEELRLKSFKDLHILWYVLLRERNLLASQKEETRRMGVENRDWQVNLTKVYHVKKSMARIKQVINERRLAYEKATELVKKEEEQHHNVVVMKLIAKKRENELSERRKARQELRMKAKNAREARQARLAAERAEKRTEKQAQRPGRRGRFFTGRVRNATTSTPLIGL